MEQLPRLNARVAMLDELRDIVRAMRVMAAGATREGEAALPAVRRYSEIMRAAMADGMALAGGGGATQSAAGAASVLCLIGTEHGFVGSLNARLVREAIRPGLEQKIVVVGRRAAAAAEEAGIDVAGMIPMTAHLKTLPTLARQVSEALAASEEVRVAFCRHDAEHGLGVVERQIVPIAPDGDAPRSSNRSANPPLHHMQAAALLAAFAEEYLLAEIASALAEAFVGENATRLRVLSAADRNIADRIDKLQRVAQQLRQEAITAELLDIVIGAEAVAES